MSDPKQVLSELFDSDDHNPFSDPNAAAQLAIEKLSEAGFVIVPREPTEAMIKEGWADATAEDAAATWRAMIDVALSESGSPATNPPSK